MSKDPIVDDLHEQRAEEMERFNYDFGAFCRSLKEQEEQTTQRLVAPPDSPPSPLVQRTRAARR